MFTFILNFPYVVFDESVNAKTSKGNLQIRTDLQDTPYKAYNEKTKKYYVDTKHVQSAMLQSWNKFCFTGGIIEISAKLPGKSSIGGLWPARELQIRFLFSSLPSS